MAVVTRIEIRAKNGTDPFDKYPIAVNIPISLNYNLADVRNPDQRKASFSKTINLNGTNEINKLFENIFSVNVATQYFNKNLKTPVRYLVNEIENFSGDLQLIKININPDNSIVYECSIIGAGGSLFVDIGEKYITDNANTSDDLDFSAYNHNYTRANQIGSRTTYLGTGTGYVYPLIDRGTNGGSDVIWNVKDFLPCFSIYEYITKIIAATGRTFTSTFLNTAEFKKLYCYSNVEKLSLTDAELANKQFYIGLNTDINITVKPATNIFSANVTLFPSTNYTESTPFFDAGGQVTSTSIVVSTSGYYNLASNIWFEFLASAATFPSENRTVAIILRNGIPITTYGNTLTGVSVGVVTKIPFAISSGEIYLNAGDIISVKYDVYNGNSGTTPTYTYFKLLKGSGQTECNLYLIATRKEITEGDPLAVNRSLPTKIKQKDFFKSVVQAFNLYVDVDPDNENNLIIETFDKFYDADIVNYENKTDLAKEQSINPNLLEGKRYIFAYKSDADYYNTLYQNTWNETYGTEQIDVVNDFIKSDKKNELIFSGTPQAANYGLGIAMPRIYQQDGTNKKTIAANIRMFYCAVKTTANTYTYKQQGLSDLITNEYLYAGMEDDPFNPTVSLMFGPPKEVYYNYVNAYFTTNNLYNRYHKNYLKNLIDKDAKFVTKYLWLNERDIYLFNFRNRLFIDGAYYIVNKIENYNPLELTSTKVELVKLLETNVFTPTSIRIKDDVKIKAGAEVYNYRLNSSLNVGTDIQNRGTNCLAVGNNIVIPASCTNLIVFGSNITADENSTGLLLNYKSYVALISQTGTAAPTAIVLENTLGDVTFSYVTVGIYKVITSGLFTNNKTFALLPNSLRGTNFIYQINTNEITINCRDITSETPFIPYLNNALDNTSIEIRVYN